MKPVLLSLLTGVLFALSLPPFDQEWLGWFAFVPLLLAARGRRPLEAVGLGMIAGAVSGAVQAGWYHDTSRLFWAYIPFLWLSFLFGGVTLAAAKVPASWNPALRVLFLSCAGISGEWLTSFLPLPLNIALCQYRQLALIQIAQITGIWGVSFLLWWMNAALAEMVPLAPNKGEPLPSRPSPPSPKRRGEEIRPAVLSETPPPPVSPNKASGGAPLAAGWVPMLSRAGTSWLPFGLGLALVLLSLGYGGSIVWQTPTATPHLRVAAIQDLTPAETGDLAGKAETDRAQMTRQAAGQGAKFIVWSEESLGGDFAPEKPKDETRQLARQTRASLVVGYSDRTWPKPYNCAAYIAPDGSVLKPVHHKIHLYLSERLTNLSGKTPTVVATPQGRIGLEICFDSCYTNTTRQEVAQAARLIALPNYDPPTPRGVLHRLHGAMLPFRAVENGVPFVRADSNGLSQIVDANGRIVGQSPLFAPDILVGDVALGNGQGTFFTRFGDWLAYLSLLLILLGVVVTVRDHRRGTME